MGAVPIAIGSAGEIGKQQSRIVAVAGFAPLAGADPVTCELRKMYALPEARGLGAGKALMESCLAGAREAGFKTMYLETVTAMTAAAKFYAQYGFTHLDRQLGHTGHTRCDVFMMRPL